MDNKEYLMNMGFFFSVIIPKEKKFYILKGKTFDHEDVQDFVNNKTIDYSKYQSVGFFYDDTENWTSYQEAENPVTYNSTEHLPEHSYIERLVAKKNTDGLLLAIKDLEKDKVKVFKKNMVLHHPF